MEPRVQVGEGTAFEFLVGAAAVADADWREVFAAGPGLHREVVNALGRRFVQRVESVGRFGWINLVALLRDPDHPWTVDDLVTAAESTEPEDLHYAAIGGDRRQLVERLGEAEIRAALAGDRRARALLKEVLAADTLVLAATRWLLTTPSAEVKGNVVELLRTWHASSYPPHVEAAMAEELSGHAAAARERLSRLSSRMFLSEAVAGLDYDPAGLDAVLTVASPRVAPIVVVVDGRQRTVLLHPPLRRPVPDRATRLLELSRAVGDRTRVQVLTLLRSGELTAVDLARSLGSPRTTLLHHLAILRAAGMIHVTVTPGGATVYRLRPEGFSDLARTAQDFISTR